MLSGQSTFDQSGLPEKVTVLQFELYFRHGMTHEARVLEQRLCVCTTSRETSPDCEEQSPKDLRAD